MSKGQCTVWYFTCSEIPAQIDLFPTKQCSKASAELTVNKEIPNI